MAAVLIVEDDPIMLAVLEEGLVADGHTVITAPSGNPALDILETNVRLDLMITDVVLPGLTGFSLSRMARMRRPMLKILYISGHPDAELDRDPGVRLGEMLKKPIQLDDFRRAVSGVLAQDVALAGSRARPLQAANSYQAT